MFIGQARLRACPEGQNEIAFQRNLYLIDTSRTCLASDSVRRNESKGI